MGCVRAPRNKWACKARIFFCKKKTKEMGALSPEDVEYMKEVPYLSCMVPCNILPL